MRLFDIKFTGKYLLLIISIIFNCQTLATEALQHPADILYILSKDSKFYQGFADKVQNHINTSNNNSQHQRSLRMIANDKNLHHELNSGYKIIISIGSAALKSISASGYQGQVISTLTPEISFTQYNSQKRYSALYADHPVSQYLKLIKRALPSSNRVGVLLGPSSTIHEAELISAARTIGLNLVIEKTEQSRHVPHKAGQLAAEVDVILAIPDPVVHNPQTAHSILSAGYRHHIPVVAYSSSYLKAGALISLYSSPEQLAADTAKLILERLKDADTPAPKTNYPPTFSIGINRTVAHSLGREGLDEAKLKTLLISGEPIKNE